jgi:hypothetical protein
VGGWDLTEIGWEGGELDSTGSGWEPMAGCCECGDEPSGSCATELFKICLRFVFIKGICFIISSVIFHDDRITGIVASLCGKIILF